MKDISSIQLAVVGLGYVGLPLAVEFAKYRQVVGFDINLARIAALQGGHDSTLEVDDAELRASERLRFTSDPAELARCNFYIVTAPTPVDAQKRPDLTSLLRASETIGKHLGRGDVVVYESTVYPGATEEECAPVLERVSNLKLNVDFFVGYSPERVNPGDKVHRVHNIKKITSGSTPEAAEWIDALYRQIVVVGTYKAPSIKVAEAAKVVENTQRDINIAIINELAQIFNKLEIDTEAVLLAAGTKWNFLPFRPGLVGGHCTGVDPYYISHKAQSVGYHPEIILAGRRLNDGMGPYVAAQLVKAMVKRRIPIVGARVLIMGLAFKENCPDLRNTRIADAIRELREYEVDVDVHDPWVDKGDAFREYGVELVDDLKNGSYDGIVLAVAHEQFRALGAPAIRMLGKTRHILYDLKYLFKAWEADIRL